VDVDTGMEGEDHLKTYIPIILSDFPAVRPEGPSRHIQVGKTTEFVFEAKRPITPL